MVVKISEIKKIGLTIRGDTDYIDCFFEVGTSDNFIGKGQVVKFVELK